MIIFVNFLILLIPSKKWDHYRVKEFVIQSGKEKFAEKKWGAGDFKKI